MHTASLFALAATGTCAIIAAAQSIPVADLGLLPGDLSVVPAPNSQTDQVVAKGGDQYLVVWADRRAQQTTSFASQSQGDLYAIRLDADGNPIDTVPFIVAATFGEQTKPKVAWNGENWLVLYVSQDPTAGYFADRLRAVRISPAGQVVDPIALTMPPTQFEPETIGLQLAVLGSQWLVTRCVYHSDGYGTYLAGQRISSAGTLLDPTPVMLMDWIYGPCTTIATNSEFLVVGPEWNDSASIKARRISSSLAPIGPAFSVPSITIESNGTDYYTTWLSNFTELVGSRISSTGSVLTPAGTFLANATTFHHSSITHDGINWWVEYGAADILNTLRVSPAGTRLDPVGGSQLPITIGGTVNNAYDPMIVGRTGGGVHVLWNDSRPAMNNDTNVSILPVNANNIAGTERVVSTSSPNQRTPDFAAGPTGQIACVFVSEAANEDRVLVHLMDASGQPTFQEPIEIFRGPMVGKATIAWNGSVYMVAFDAGTPSPGAIYTARMNADGVLIDTPASSMIGFRPDIEALDDTFLVAASRLGATPQIIRAIARRFDGASNSPIDASDLVLLANGYVSSGPRVRSDGTRWLVTYHSHWTHNSSQSDAVFNFVNADGSFSPPVNPTTSSGGAGTPDVAFSGNEYLFVWRSNTLASGDNYISGRIMHADGTFAPNAFVIAQATGRQLTPTVSWDGSHFIVAWEDQREQAAFYDLRTDVYAARVTEAGSVVDVSSISIKSDEHGVVEPALVSRDGVTLIATAQMIDEPTLDSYRIGLSIIGAPTCPPCPADFDRNGGVDGGDLGAFFNDYEQGLACADVDQNGGIDAGDLAAFFVAFEAGGCD